jgi:integrase
MALTDTLIKTAKPTDKPYKLADSRGLFLLVSKAGKYWRLKYRFAGKEKLLAIGVYPAISLKDARHKADEAKQLLLDGIDPAELRKVNKAAKVFASGNSFQAIALEWHTLKKASWSESHAKKTLWNIETNLFPWLGNRPIAEIKSPEVLAALRRIESRGAGDTAHRAKQIAGQVFRYAVATGRAESDPTYALKGALAPVQQKHFAAIIDPVLAGKMILDISQYQGTPIVRVALKISALCFQRPTEIRTMRWADVDLSNAEWSYFVTKTKLQHIVPLSRQAVIALQELQPLTGRSEFVFPSARGASRPLSENGVRVALRTMGYDNETMTAHGFRAMARTMLHEQLGYPEHWMEHQLAHAVKDANGRAYNRATLLPQRREMMQAWADYLDTLEAQARGENVVPVAFNRKSKT